MQKIIFFLFVVFFFLGIQGCPPYLKRGETYLMKKESKFLKAKGAACSLCPPGHFCIEVKGPSMGYNLNAKNFAVRVFFTKEITVKNTRDCMQGGKRGKRWGFSVPLSFIAIKSISSDWYAKLLKTKCAETKGHTWSCTFCPPSP